MHICVDVENCAGCSACKTICPVNAIEMRVSDIGFWMPEVDAHKCVECGRCIEVCPAMKAQKENKKEEETKAFAFYNSNSDVRFTSSSGGFFLSIAQYVIQMGGYVCGCVMKDLEPVHVLTKKWSIVRQMQGSKYVQSDVSQCYSEICELLERGEMVLFTGTSCQIQGLKSLIELKNIETSNLICVDFICHGVPSTKVWREYVALYKEKSLHEVIDYKFRNKKYGWGTMSKGGDFLPYFVSVDAKKKEKIDDWSWLSRIWRMIFLSNLCIRPYCHNCPYASINKPADITMADFWGIEKVAPEFDDGKGCSLILVHTFKGQRCFDNLQECRVMSVEVRSATKNQTNISKPSAPHKERERFWKDYEEKGFKYVLNKYFNYTVRGRIKAYIKRMLFEFNVRNLY